MVVAVNSQHDGGDKCAEFVMWINDDANEIKYIAYAFNEMNTVKFSNIASEFGVDDLSSEKSLGYLIKWWKYLVYARKNASQDVGVNYTFCNSEEELVNMLQQKRIEQLETLKQMSRDPNCNIM